METLDENWLAIELDSIDAEIDQWSDGLKASLQLPPEN